MGVLIHTVEFLTVEPEKKKVLRWAVTNDLLKFYDLLEYFIDNIKEAEEMILKDTINGKYYKVGSIMERYNMRKRTFPEKIDNIHIGTLKSKIDQTIRRF